MNNVSLNSRSIIKKSKGDQQKISKNITELQNDVNKQKYYLIMVMQRLEGIENNIDYILGERLLQLTKGNQE